MGTLQDLLIHIGSQKLGAGYLTPAGNSTAHDTLRALKQQFDPIVLAGAPITSPALLMTPAWISSLAQGQDAIYLAGVDGNLNKTNGPAYKFA